MEARHDTATDAELVTVWNLMDIPGIAYEVGETLDGYATEIQSEKKVIKRKMVGADAPGSQEYEIEETYWEVIMYNLPDTVDIMVTKKWDDDHNRDGIRPQASDFEDAVRVFYSYETCEKTITGEVDMNTLPIQVYVTDNQDDTYTIHVAGLPEYSPEGIHIHYTIGEGDIPGYTKDTDTAAPDGVLTNWHDTEKTNIVVRKQWSDVGHVDARPETITVRLHANGEVVAVQQMNKADQWKAVHFLDLPVYEDGEPIVYTITEDAVKDYTHHIDEENHIITNTYNPGKTDIDVEKVWHDSHNRDGIRPRMVMVHLYADGVDTGRTLQLSEDNQWYGAFENLDEKKNGETIVYTVRENPVDGYETEITGDAETVFSVVNTHESKTTGIMVQKIWNDAGHESARPESITVRLHANGAEIAAREMTRESNWAPVVFEDLPAYDHGFGVVYTITEDVVPNYTHHIDQQADTITNTYHPGMTSIDVEKVWRDGNNEKNTRPQFVTVRLYADGVDTGKTLILDEASRWAGTFEELEKHRNGHEIVYTVREEPVAGYMAHIGGSMHVGYTLTNTLTGSGNGGEGEFREFNPYTHRFSFTKVWRGGTGDSIEWTLYGSDGTEVHKAFNKTVVSDSEWQYEAWFSRNDDFYVVETVPAGYMVIYENTGAHSGVTDRCYNGGRIINYKMPRTGDPDRIALWAGMSLLSLMGMALILRRRGKNR